MSIDAVKLNRVFNAPIEQVFAAWSDPSIMPQWLFPWDEGQGKTVNTFEVGGHYQHDMNDPDTGDLYPHTGEYVEIVKPTKIVFTWNSPVVENTLVSIDLKGVGNGTSVTLTHDQFTDEERRDQHGAGWEGCFDNLEKYLHQ